jgi:hypothetical protein
LLGAIRQRGWVTLQAMFATTNADRFVAWLTRQLLPRLRPSDVLIMDNLAAHHNARVRPACRARRVRLLYLPPYSPDLNPIELACGLVPMTVRLASALKQHRHLRGRRVLLQATGELMTQKVVQDHLRRAYARPGSAHSSAHLLLAPGDARSASAGHPGTRGAPGVEHGLEHDAAVHAPESRRDRGLDSATRSGSARAAVWRHVEDGEGEAAKVSG